MKRVIAYCLLSIAYLLNSCSSNKTENAADAKQALILQIDSLNKSMFDKQTMVLDKTLALKAIASYNDFVAKFPDDTAHCAEYLFRQSDLARAVGDKKATIDCLSRICTNYPSFNKLPDCVFLQGYYYQEFYQDTIRAKQFYHELITKYPNNAFVDDAQALMQMFGKSEEGIIKQFEKNAQASKK